MSSQVALWQQVLDNLTEVSSRIGRRISSSSSGISSSGLHDLLPSDNIKKLLQKLSSQPKQPAEVWARLIQDVQVRSLL
jgi:hypothetical protein